MMTSLVVKTPLQQKQIARTLAADAVDLRARVHNRYATTAP